MRRWATYLLFISVAALTVVGLAMLYSTTVAMYGEGLLKKQAVWVFLGIVAATVLLKFGDYRQFGTKALWLMLAVAAPLWYLAAAHLMYRLHVPDSILSKLPLLADSATKGAYRWLVIWKWRVQPSEFARLLTVLFLAHHYGTTPRYVHSFRRGILEPLGVVGVVVVAILLSGSLSLTVITGATILAMLFVAGIRLRWFVIFFAVGALLFWGALRISPERLSRVTTYQTPEKYKDNECYQLYHSQLALGSGYWHGVGFTQSRMKEYYLPEAHNDFIISIIGEELGYLRLLGVMALYLVLLAAAFGISITACDREGMLLAFGIGAGLGLNVCINIGVVSGYLPTTGITAPLISYGGSSLLVTWISVGLLANIARVAQQQPEPASTKPRLERFGGLFSRVPLGLSPDGRHRV